MKRKILIVLGIIYLAVIVEFILYMTSDSKPELTNMNNQVKISEKSISQKSAPAKPIEDQPDFDKVEDQGAKQSFQPVATVNQTQDDFKDQAVNSITSPGDDFLQEEQETAYADIEEIKHKIYDMRIEYIEQLEELEQIDQTGNTDQANFWEGEWHSVDDWKRRNDAFQLEINKDGAFSFFTDDRIHQSSQAFTFNKEIKEFYWEEDYYGKIITHRAKFITPSTLLVIKTSGVKVNLDIYKKAQ